MDPVSQGTIGAIASQNLADKKHIVTACLYGFLSGLAPDLDVFIRSANDPLLFLEYHRQFTHALIFIPVGGLICSLILYLLTPTKWKIPFSRTLLYCTAAYATHALLDTCTSYGTQLFWPFSNVRISWHVISIIDPLFTLPLLILVLLAAVKRKIRYAQYAAVWVFVYLSLGILQRERAERIGWQIAHSREHQPARIHAKPALANLLLWKTIYEYQDRYYVDGVRVALQKRIYPGESIASLDIKRDFPWLSSGSQQAKDIERFRWFSDGFLAVDPTNSSRIIDMRYSMLPNQIRALWMIELDPHRSPDDHVGYVHEPRDNRNTDKTFGLYLEMLKGR